MNSEGARSDFFALHDAFARAKRKVPLLKRQRFNEYLRHADVFVLYFDGQPTCGRLVLRDVESGTALMLCSGTKRLEGGTDTITIGLLNRYLHWHEMKVYQAAGMRTYDFGGAASAQPSLTQFKRSFGAQLITYHYGLYARTERMVWALASRALRGIGRPDFGNQDPRVELPYDSGENVRRPRSWRSITSLTKQYNEREQSRDRTYSPSMAESAVESMLSRGRNLLSTKILRASADDCCASESPGCNDIPKS
jgi:hypothetical protein